MPGDTIAEPHGATGSAWANDVVECGRIGMTGSGQRVMRGGPARWRCRVLEDEAREALLASPLGALPVDVRHALCRDAVMIDVPAGSQVFRKISDMFAFVVVRGVIRAYVADATGRQLTIAAVRRVARLADRCGRGARLAGAVTS